MLEEVSVYETFWKKRRKPCLCDTTAGCIRSVKIKYFLFYQATAWEQDLFAALGLLKKQPRELASKLIKQELSRVTGKKILKAVYVSYLMFSLAAKACPDPGRPENGDRFGYFRVGSTVRFSCQSGFEMHGSRERTCLENKEWSGSLTTCQDGSKLDVADFSEISESFVYTWLTSYEFEAGVREKWSFLSSYTYSKGDMQLFGNLIPSI